MRASTLSLFLLFPAPRRSIALGHGGIIFLDVLRMPPVRHIVTLAGEDIHLAQHDGQEAHRPRSAIIPAFATINAQAAPPPTIHLTPYLICQLSVVTAFNQLGLRVFFQRLQCLLWIAPILRHPSIIRTTGRTLLSKVRIELFQREFVPNRFCILEIKKVLGQHFLLRLSTTHVNKH